MNHRELLNDLMGNPLTLLSSSLFLSCFQDTWKARYRSKVRVRRTKQFRLRDRQQTDRVRYKHKFIDEIRLEYRDNQGDEL